MSKCHVKHIVTALPLLYIEELEDPILKFGNVSPFEIPEHLRTTCEEVTAEDLDKNIEYMNQKWMPPMLIEALYKQLRKEKKYAEDTGEIIPNTILIRFGYNNIEDTGLCSHACCEWCITTTKSWISFSNILPSTIGTAKSKVLRVV